MKLYKKQIRPIAQGGAWQGFNPESTPLSDWIDIEDSEEQIENQLKELEKIPHYAVNPKNKNQSKITGAGKFYKDLSQMYDNKIKIIQKAISNCDSETQDSFDDWINSRL